MKNLLLKIQKVIFVGLLILVYSRDLAANYGWTSAFHTTFLAWTFFVLCLPFATGNVVIKIPYEFITSKKMLYPPAVTWTLAILGNFISYHIFPFMYFRTATTQSLYSVLTDLGYYWPVILTSFIATFYGIILENSTKKRNINFRLLGVFFRLASIIATVIFLFNDFILVLNTHGNV
ncbi:TPA: hypothetical protein DEO28_01820 [Candidatus Dependentiae bacterium]|nr:MAG: hypothetical protein UR14_C0004G0054 [candidate division TM6 bacterium GW2011_GWE2_31_21]KKP52972.1 MAG: hypothetical protein UR43_C0008G0054 [candidate division TM6 bacterium GW2011_GWF2_33_332]HBS47790.1 hypothetical protein [Candidatus Dependentiae bacterium]HBZ73234.1 hypothetical protein [Candidatus Dependentiae bacterium]